MKKLRPDIAEIVKIVSPGTSALDLGCGDGTLLALLAREKNVRGQGVEINPGLIADCVRAGVNVVYGDLDHGLADYPDQSFDYVILNNCIPEVEKPQEVLLEALRVGQRAIIGFANYCHCPARWQMAVLGRVPVTRQIPYHWYETPNRHFLSIRDFTDFCREKRIRVLERHFLAGRRTIRFTPNMLADYAIFKICSGREPERA